MDKPDGLTIDEMKELVRWLNERIIDQVIAAAVEKANHDQEKEQNSEE